MNDSPVIRLLKDKLKESCSLIDSDFDNLFSCAEQQVIVCNNKLSLITDHVSLMRAKLEELEEGIRKPKMKQDTAKAVQVEASINAKFPSEMQLEERIILTRKSLLRFSTKEYCDTASPSTLVMQDYYPLEIRGEVFDIALVLVWGEKHPCSFQMCFPRRMENYGPLTVNLDILDLDGKPVITKGFDVDPVRGNCGNSKLGILHNDCAEPSFSSRAFFVGDERKLFVQCLRKTRKRPSRVTFFPAHVCIEQNNVSKDTAEPYRAAFASNEKDPIFETSLQNAGVEVISGFSDLDSLKENAKQEYFTDVNALNNLSEEAMNCYSDWLTSEISDGWIKNLAINLELLHFAYKYNLCELKSICRKHILDLSVGNSFTPQQCLEILAAAFSYNDFVILKAVSKYTGMCSESLEKSEK